MKKVTISINNLSDIKALSQMASSASGLVFLRRGQFCVDAASLLGVISLDLSNPVICEYEESNIGLDNFLSNFIVSGE